MENNNQYNELLFRYLTNEVNIEERRFVEEWIHAEEDHHHHFVQFKNTWQLSSVKPTLDYVLDEMNVEEKWKQFRQRVDERETAEHAGYAEGIVKMEVPEPRPLFYRFLVRTVAAASIVLILGFGWKFFLQTKPESPVVQNTTKESDHLAFDVRRVVNTTGKEKKVQLSDGSLVLLANNSELTYTEPFFNWRHISIIGKGYFKVAKDKTRPFTVSSGDLSTTALGTEFTVTAPEGDKFIIVRLYEGKVVISSKKKMISDVYLLPGQEFIYNMQPNTKLKSFRLSKAAPEQIMKQEVLRDNPDLPLDEEGSWYMFNNQPLAQVLDQFASLYNVQISYDKKDVQNIYFVGQYTRGESLEKILKRIGTMNKLTIAKKDSAYIISR